MCIGAAVLAVCLFVLPPIIQSELAGDVDYAPVLLGLYVTAIPFFFALVQAFRLLRAIDRGQAFSKLSVHALGNIKYCAIAISAMFIMGLPYLFHLADRDDAPGLLALALVIVFASMVIATFAALLQKLLQSAADIKSENDLTV